MGQLVRAKIFVAAPTAPLLRSGVRNYQCGFGVHGDIVPALHAALTPAASDLLTGLMRLPGVTDIDVSYAYSGKSASNVTVFEFTVNTDDVFVSGNLLAQISMILARS